MHFSNVLLPLPLRPTIPKNSPCPTSSEMLLTACSSSYEVLRSGCSTRSLSVEYCWWGMRKVLLTCLMETAGGAVCVLPAEDVSTVTVALATAQCTLAIAAATGRISAVGACSRSQREALGPIRENDVAAAR